jgi:predicted membrane GTPase involved in stress response
MSRPLVVVNKVDRQSSRVAQVESDLFDLFATLGATDEQADYPLLYASAKQGWASDTVTPTSQGSSMEPLFDLILSHVPPPTHLASTGPFSMLTVQIENDPYLGVLYLGRIHSGTLSLGDTLWAIDVEGNKIGEGKVKRILGRKGLEKEEKEAAGAGEIVSVAGIKGGGINMTLVHPDGWGSTGPQPLPVSPSSNLLLSISS